jgi:hypothetical protein
MAGRDAESKTYLCLTTETGTRKETSAAPHKRTTYPERKYRAKSPVNAKAEDSRTGNAIPRWCPERADLAAACRVSTTPHSTPCGGVCLHLTRQPYPYQSPHPGPMMESCTTSRGCRDRPLDWYKPLPGNILSCACRSAAACEQLTHKLNALRTYIPYTSQSNHQDSVPPYPAAKDKTQGSRTSDAIPASLGAWRIQST